MSKKAFRPEEAIRPDYPARRPTGWEVVLTVLALMLIAVGVGAHYREQLDRLYRRYILREPVIVLETVGDIGP